jgi:adenine-specific DNA-methyltransferase
MPSLDFKGKQFVYTHHLTVPFRELEVDAKKSLPAKKAKPSMDDNLIIHGDNLHALKALLPRYAGKVKCIYIDPPYNTGNEGWCYNDNVRSPLMKEWVERGNPVDGEDMERHDKWLSMMWPRLQLLRELLTYDGVIFISIDDNEQHRLRALMDEIFGEVNFVANIVWQKKYAASNDATGIPAMHDFITVYQKTSKFDRNLLPRTEKQDAAYKNDDGDGRGLWRSDNLLVKSFSETGVFPIVNPNTGEKFLPKKGNSWRANNKTINQWMAEGRIFFGKDGKGAPQLKRFLNEVQQGVVPVTWWAYEDGGHNDQANKELQSLFGAERVPFETPKPTKLIERLLQIATGKNDVVLDSFAGSGTTAHATLTLNKADGGNRKFILIECEDYANKITAERVRRVIKGVRIARDENIKKGLGGSFTYTTLGQEINVETLLKGGRLPDFPTLARYVFYTATVQTLEKVAAKPGKDFYIGETDMYRVHLVYKPDREFLRSGASALNSELVQRIAAGNKSKKKALVFATAKFMGQRELSEQRIEFAQLPYAIYRVLGE